MVQCEVKFDNNSQGIYYSGQNLSGVVELNNEKARNVRGLSLRIEGFAKCKWTESEGTGKHRRTIQYSGREDYINTFSYLIGSTTVNQTELAAAKFKFNFTCQLPVQLPTSFESKYGHIRYQIKVELERPWKFDLKYCFAFTVIKILDLNYESPALRCPLKTEKSKSFFLGLSGKPLFVAAEIPFSGFVAGQSVPIMIKVNNDSGTDVEETKVSLIKKIYYISQTPRRKTKERIESAAEIRHSGYPSKSRGTVEAFLNLPPVPPSNTASCTVLQVSYEIHVKFCVSGLHRSPVLCLPIVIGTVPLQGYHQAPSYNMAVSNINAYPSTSRPILESTAPFSTEPISTSVSHDMPPPSYAQAMNMGSIGTDTDEGLNEEKSFSPMYPVFNFAPNAPIEQPPAAYGFASASNYDYQEKKSF